MYGIVLAVRGDLASALFDLMKLSGRHLLRVRPRRDSTIALKFQIAKNEKELEWCRDEAAALYELSANAKTAEYVPKFFFSAEHGSGARHLFVIGMERVAGKMLSRVPLTPKVLCEVERAVHALWRWGGIAHDDLHEDNVLITPTGRAVLIDFGRMHPHKYARSLRAFRSNALDAMETANAKLVRKLRRLLVAD